MNWIATITVAAFGFMLFLIKEQYKRGDIDVKNVEYEQINNSSIE